MIGHKYNLKEFLLDLKAEGIKYTTTEFCQGRVTRWGVAWTYQNCDLSKLGWYIFIISVYSFSYLCKRQGFGLEGKNYMQRIIEHGICMYHIHRTIFN